MAFTEILYGAKEVASCLGHLHYGSLAPGIGKTHPGRANKAGNGRDDDDLALWSWGILSCPLVRRVEEI